jgi:hypothetical protein
MSEPPESLYHNVDGSGGSGGYFLVIKSFKNILNYFNAENSFNIAQYGVIVKESQRELSNGSYR